MTHRNHVLVLRSGMGVDVMYALNKGAENIRAVEPNSTIVSMLKNELASTTDSLFYNSKISLHAIEPRTFLLTDTVHYDLITLPVVGTFGGSCRIICAAGTIYLHEGSLQGNVAQTEPTRSCKCNLLDGLPSSQSPENSEYNDRSA